MNIQQFIEDNIDLIDNNNFTELYNRCVSTDREQLTAVLYSCDINPLDYLTEIPEWFASRTNITSITIPDIVTRICWRAFSECTSLTNVTIGNSVESIGSYAFYSCNNLTNITVPSSVTYIGEGAFSSCTNLANITIPNSVTSIRSYAFEDCGNLQISYLGTKQEWKNLVTEVDSFSGTAYVCSCSDGVVKKSR